MVAADPAVRRIRVRLPAAEAVYVMGPFNNWSTTGTPMSRLGDGWWEAAVPLANAGRMRMFVWESGQRCGQLVPLELCSSSPGSVSDEPIVCAPADDSSVMPVLRA